MNPLKVNNIFFSIQCEGFHVGEACIFIRLAGCNENCAYCDTDWMKGSVMDEEEILLKIARYPVRKIIWTGGEPTLQLTDKVVAFFNHHEYVQYIETNGSNKVPHGIQHISCSPKVSVEILKKNFSFNEVGEFRCLIGQDKEGIRCFPPPIESLPVAKHYYVSPLFVGKNHEKYELDKFNLDLAVDWVKNDPRWNLSIQLQKLIHIP